MKYLQSYQSKILLSFVGLIFVLAGWVYFQYQIDTRNDKLIALTTKVNDLETGHLAKTRHLQNFLLSGFHQESFYTQGTQSDIDSFETYLHKNYTEISKIKLQMQHSGMDVDATIDSLAAENKKLVSFITELKTIYLAKGYKDFGVEGKMRYYAHLLEDSSAIPELYILQLRRSEKDFLLRGELKYADNFFELIDKLILKKQGSPKTLEMLLNYKKNFTILTDYNRKIGIYSTEGLYNLIQTQLSSLDRRYLQLYQKTNETVARFKSKNNFFLYIGATFFLIAVIFTIWRLSKYLSKEIKELNRIIVEYINSEFKTESDIDGFKPKILEVGTLHSSFRLLKDKLKYMLKERHNHQKMLVSAVIEGQEKERKNIGAELHDNINPLLATAKLYLNVARDSEEERLQMIQTSKDIIEDTLQEIRKLSHALVGPANEFLLQESLKELVVSVEGGVSFDIRFASNNFDESQVSDDKKLTIYRIVQEQLNNVVKYSRADNVLVSILENKNELLLSIKDNGVGFDTKQKTKGIGLRNIETRLELVNGKMFLITSPGHGCEMIVSVPVLSN